MDCGPAVTARAQVKRVVHLYLTLDIRVLNAARSVYSSVHDKE